jgi:tRNA nucleotidyltransferase (CCA-adding enzyme)
MMKLPEDVKNIINILQEHGHEAYAVGGCVRDSILGREPEDWDITTSARPDEMKAIFPRSIDTGIEHGTITVLMGKGQYELTTYRIDGEYEDSRHPKEVLFTSNLREDLLRRDFTINAMAYNEETGLVDIFGGIEDLERGVIRCVGNAEERFSEDALRIMRAVRFAAQLDFVIEEETAQAIRKLAPTLEKISAERIQTELVKMLLSPHPERIRQAYELGITAVVLPEFDRTMETKQHNPHHMYTVGEHTIQALMQAPADRMIRMALLFHDMGKPEMKTTDEDGVDHFKRHNEASARICKEVLRRLKFDNETIRTTEKLIYYHDYRVALKPSSVRKLISLVGEELFPLLLQVQRADLLAQSMYMRAEKMNQLDEIDRIYREILERRDCLSLKDLAVNGRDLIEAGMKPGKEIGAILQEMLQEVLEDPSKNTKEYLLTRVN